MTTSSRRIPPQLPDEWSDSTHEALASVVPMGSVPRPVHLPAVIAHHPSFLKPYLGWAKAVALGGVLPARANELLALRTALLCGSPFEWGVHTQYALGGGSLDAADIRAIAEGPNAERWSDSERALLRAADELHDTTTVSDATWAELARDHDRAALLEIVFIVGHYTMLSMVTNAAGVEPEADWPSLGAASD